MLHHQEILQKLDAIDAWGVDTQEKLNDTMEKLDAFEQMHA